MGLLDSNIVKALPQVKSGTINAASLSAIGYIGDANIDKTNYNRFDFKITFSGSSTHSIKLFGNYKNSSLSAVTVYNSSNEAVSTISTDGNYYFYAENINFLRFRNSTTASGDTVTIDWYLKNVRYPDNQKKLDKIYSAVNPKVTDNPFIEFSLSNNGFVGGYIDIDSSKSCTLAFNISFTGGDNGRLSLRGRTGDIEQSYSYSSLPIYNEKGEIYNEISSTGLYFVNISGLCRVRFYLENNVSPNITVNITYRIVDSVINIEQLKPIQQLYSADFNSTNSTSSFTMDAVIIPKVFKYFFIVGYYELSGTAKNISVDIASRDYISYVDNGTTVKRYFNTNIYSCVDVSSFKSGFIENQQMEAGQNWSITLNSTPVADAVFHIKIFGVR